MTLKKFCKKMGWQKLRRWSQAFALLEEAQDDLTATQTELAAIELELADARDDLSRCPAPVLREWKVGKYRGGHIIEKGYFLEPLESMTKAMGHGRAALHCTTGPALWSENPGTAPAYPIGENHDKDEQYWLFGHMCYGGRAEWERIKKELDLA